MTHVQFFNIYVHAFIHIYTCIYVYMYGCVYIYIYVYYVSSLFQCNQAKRMTCDQFVNNNRGIDDGADLPTVLLRRLYASVVAREIRIEQREFIQASHQVNIILRVG